MYTHVFCFRFSENLPPAQRMLFLAEIFQVPEQIGARATDIYWHQLSHDGTVEFYSNTPELTEALEQRLGAAETSGLIIVGMPGMRSCFAFLGRAVTGLLGAAIRTVWPGRSRGP